MKLTAKEIEHDIFWDGIVGGKNHGGKYTKAEKIEMIKEYAKRKCKEQREMCAEGFLNTNDPIGHEILNNPEPEFD